MMSLFGENLLHARKLVGEARAHLSMCELTQIDLEFKALEKIPKFYDVPHQICTFASAVRESIGAIKNLGRSEYLISASMMTCLIGKMPPRMKSRWHKYISNCHSNVKHLGLLLIHEFLGVELNNNAFRTKIRNRKKNKGVQQKTIAKNKQKNGKASHKKTGNSKAPENRAQMSVLKAIKIEPELIAIKMEPADVSAKPATTNAICLRSIKIEKVED